MASKHRGCTRRRHYTTCKKKRSCKWVKRGKSHKGYCKKRTKRRRQRGGMDITLSPSKYGSQAPAFHPFKGQTVPTVHTFQKQAPIAKTINGVQQETKGLL